MEPSPPLPQLPPVTDQAAYHFHRATRAPSICVRTLQVPNIRGFNLNVSLVLPPANRFDFTCAQETHIHD